MIEGPHQRLHHAALNKMTHIARAKYLYDQRGTLYRMVQAYRKSVTGEDVAPDGWYPRDDHLLAMWNAWRT